MTGRRLDRFAIALKPVQLCAELRILKFRLPVTSKYARDEGDIHGVHNGVASNSHGQLPTIGRNLARLARCGGKNGKPKKTVYAPLKNLSTPVANRGELCRVTRKYSLKIGKNTNYRQQGACPNLSTYRTPPIVKGPILIPHFNAYMKHK